MTTIALPQVLAEFVTLIGEAATLAIMREFGGQAIVIPITPRAALWVALVECIGLNATETLARPLGGQVRYIAKNADGVRAARNAAMGERYDALLQQGLTTRAAVAVLVKEYGLTHRQIENILNRPVEAEAERQLLLL